ncbi:MAG: response regulator [Candidatus Omnitrophota bacterium]
MQPAKRILIVDDEKFVTDTLEGFFKSRGYEIFKAEDGQTCLDIIKKDNLDLVLLDIKLPKVDGIEILTLLRRDYPQVRVIVMTAYDIEYKALIDRIGCDAFFIKPLLIDELTDKVVELLSQEKVSSASIAKPQEHIPSGRKTESTSLPENAFPKARILIVSPRDLISVLLRDCFTERGICNGLYEVSKSGLDQLDYIRKFHPDIILLDVVFVGVLGEFGTTLLKMPNPPKEIILFGDPAVTWGEAESLAKRGIKFIEMPANLHDEAYPVKEAIRRLSDAVREACIKHNLYEEGKLNG